MPKRNVLDILVQNPMGASHNGTGKVFSNGRTTFLNAGWKNFNNGRRYQQLENISRSIEHLEKQRITEENALIEPCQPSLIKSNRHMVLDKMLEQNE
jgi:hypothetical protein